MSGYKLYKVEMSTTTYVAAKNEKDALRIIRDKDVETEIIMDSTYTHKVLQEVKEGDSLSKGWRKKMIPWGGDDNDDVTISQLFRENRKKGQA